MVAQGQVVPVLPGGQLYQAIGAGEMAIREVLLRSVNIRDEPNIKLPGFSATEK